MGTVHDMVWEDGVEDPFATMPAVILVAVDKYTGPASIAINGIYVVPVVPAEAQWEVKHEVCQRKQFPLVLAFAITIHKSQSLTLAKVVLNFERKDFTSGLSYVAVLRVRNIEHVMFEIAFSRDHFPAVPTPVVKRRIAEGLARRYKLARSPDELTLSTSPTPFSSPLLSPPLFSPPPPSPSPPSPSPPSPSLPSPSPPSPPPPLLVLPVSSSPPVDPALFDGLRGKTISEALQLGEIQQMHDLISLPRDNFTELFRKIQQKDGCIDYWRLSLAASPAKW